MENTKEGDAGAPGTSLDKAPPAKSPLLIRKEAPLARNQKAEKKQDIAEPEKNIELQPGDEKKQKKTGTFAADPKRFYKGKVVEVTR